MSADIPDELFSISELIQKQRAGRFEVDVGFGVRCGGTLDDRVDYPVEKMLLYAEIANVGSNSIFIDSESIVFLANEIEFSQEELDIFGKHTIPAPLEPGACARVEVFLEELASLISAGPKDKISVGLAFKADSGRVLRSIDEYIVHLEIDGVFRTPRPGEYFCRWHGWGT